MTDSTTSQHPVGRLHKWPRGPRSFATDFASKPKDENGRIPAPGTQIEVLEGEGRSAGFGIWHPRSRIAWRRVRQDGPYDDAWLANRARQAVANRRMSGVLLQDPCRILHAEADGFPGLVVDRYGPVLVAELYTEAAVPLWQAIQPALAEALDAPHFRAGLAKDAARAERADPWESVSEACPEELEVQEAGIRYRLNFRGSHKTGFFCDQRENRARFHQEVARLAARRKEEGGPAPTVLDVCCFNGGFSLVAAAAGAGDILALDLDEDAVALAKAQANLNMANKIRVRHTDAFIYLRQLQENGRTFDFVVLDPPKFVSQGEDRDLGMLKYRDLNMLGAIVTAPGGRLLTCSCSGRVRALDFQETVRQGVKRSGRNAKIEAQTGAGPDHPVALDFPEGAYLKALWLRLDS